MYDVIISFSCCIYICFYYYLDVYYYFCQCYFIVTIAFDKFHGVM